MIWSRPVASACVRVCVGVCVGVCGYVWVCEDVCGIYTYSETPRPSSSALRSADPSLQAMSFVFLRSAERIKRHWSRFWVSQLLWQWKHDGPSGKPEPLLIIFNIFLPRHYGISVFSPCFWLRFRSWKCLQINPSSKLLVVSCHLSLLPMNSYYSKLKSAYALFLDSNIRNNHSTHLPTIVSYIEIFSHNY